MNKNLDEAARWLTQAEADLRVARWDYEGKFWWEVCFKCQQAVEKALKGYCYGSGERAVLTHSLLEIGRRCEKHSPGFSKFTPIFSKLDKYYIVARYPNGLPGLTPAEYFDREEASESLARASEILAFVKAKLEEIGLTGG